MAQERQLPSGTEAEILVAAKQRANETLARLMEDNNASDALKINTVDEGHFAKQSILSGKKSGATLDFIVNKTGGLDAEGIYANVAANAQRAKAVLEESGISSRIVDHKDAEDGITRVLIDMTEQNMAALREIAYNQRLADRDKKTTLEGATAAGLGEPQKSANHGVTP